MTVVSVKSTMNFCDLLRKHELYQTSAVKATKENRFYDDCDTLMRLRIGSVSSFLNELAKQIQKRSDF